MAMQFLRKACSETWSYKSLGGLNVSEQESLVEIANENMAVNSEICQLAHNVALVLIVTIGNVCWPRFDRSLDERNPVLKKNFPVSCSVTQFLHNYSNDRKLRHSLNVQVLLWKSHSKSWSFAVSNIYFTQTFIQSNTQSAEVLATCRLHLELNFINFAFLFKGFQWHVIACQECVNAMSVSLLWQIPIVSDP